MKNIKYIVLDFDGTILNEKGEASSELVNKLISMQEEGYKVILCSGRSYLGIQWFAKKINLAKYSGYIVAYNGSKIYEYDNMEIKNLYSIEFEEKDVEEIAKLVKDDVQSLVTYCENYMGVTNYIERLDKSARIMGLKLSKDYIKKTPKIVLFDTPKNIKKQYHKIKEEIESYDETINVFSSVPHILEITPNSALKGSALKYLANIKNLSSKEFICFGDNENDLSMFEYCMYGVAVDNAIDEVKKKSTHQTKSNNEDGVYHFLNNNF